MPAFGTNLIQIERYEPHFFLEESERIETGAFSPLRAKNKARHCVLLPESKSQDWKVMKWNGFTGLK